MPSESQPSAIVPVQVDLRTPDSRVLEQAAQILLRGGLVVFPTETVYGLGAHALDRTAVAKIFAVKGRPAHNPLIVHVADVTQARALTTRWPDIAEKLAAKFWPGPLTMVLPRSPMVPDEVTGGGSTVALRIPAHPVALALLSRAAIPVAAPSANRSGSLSPTRAEHVVALPAIDMVLDAGPTAAGLESTVIDLTAERPRILRPGPLLPSDLSAVAGTTIEHAGGEAAEGSMDESAVPLKSPGLMARHYAPRTRLELIVRSPDHGRARVAALLADNLRVGWMPCAESVEPLASPRVTIRRMSTDPAVYGRLLYAVLHDLDRLDLDRAVVELPSFEDERWQAIHDRLRRAAVPATDEG